MIEVRIQEEDFSIEREWSKCRARMGGEGGAIVAFAGLVRERFEEHEVRGLQLEHYPGMTETSIERIVDYAVKKWSLLDVLIIHRVGRLESRDQIVLVMVGSGHRPDAFAACECIMDFLKTEAVFWKKELGAEHSRWVESTLNDRDRRSSWEL
ncbi:MAG: molybdenum cofactor biosynthesis protein MoaE [Pseudomonadales bacterium]